MSSGTTRLKLRKNNHRPPAAALGCAALHCCCLAPRACSPGLFRGWASPVRSEHRGGPPLSSPSFLWPRTCLPFREANPPRAPDPSEDRGELACEVSAPALKRSGLSDPGTPFGLSRSSWDSARWADRPSVRFKLPASCREDGTGAQRRDWCRGSQARANEAGLRLREERFVQGDSVT